MNKNEKYFLIGMLFFSMLIVSISFSFRGIFIPTFKEEFQVSNKAIGIFLSIIQLTSMSTYIIGIKLNEKFGQKKIMTLGLGVNMLSFIAISFAQSFIHLTIGYIFITFATSIILLSINTTIPLIHVAFQSTLLNLVHGFFGVGNTFSQKIVGFLVENGFTWEIIYRYISLGFLVAFILYMFAYDVKGDDLNNKGSQKIQDKKKLILFIFALGFYVSAEIQTGNWFMNLLKTEYAYSPSHATTYTAIFFGTFTFGRFIGGFITEKIGYFKSIIYTSVLTVITYTIGLVLKENGLYLISSAGIFLAIVFPTTMALIGKVFKDTASKAIAITSTSIAVFVLFSGLIIGFLNDLIGAYLAFYMIPIYAFISLLFYLKLNTLVSNESETI
jgi:fucose permease